MEASAALVHALLAFSAVVCCTISAVSIDARNGIFDAFDCHVSQLKPSCPHQLLPCAVHSFDYTCRLQHCMLDVNFAVASLPSAYVICHL